MSTDEDESNLDVISGIRGYEVTAIVACILIISAIFMCCLTWKFRYKIVLRTKTHKSTVVENLVAQALQQTLDLQYPEQYHHGHWNERRRSTMSAPNKPRPRSRITSLTLPGPHPLTESVLENEEAAVVSEDAIDTDLKEVNGEVATE
ncbi:hypothetical protein ACHWQZ_G003918 [Mnemiopsis leidyi]